MIVTCPACKLEQPQDEFCAGCGKSLERLLKKQREKNRAKAKKAQKTLKTLSFALLLTLLSYFVLKNSRLSPFVNSPEQKIRLSTLKISLEKEEPIETPAPPPKLKKEKLKASTPQVVKKEVIETEPSFSINLEDFYLIALQDCPQDLPTGALDAKKLKQVLSCGTEVFRLNETKSEALVDESSGHSISINFKQKEGAVILDFTISSKSFSIEDSIKIELPEPTHKAFSQTYAPNFPFDEADLEEGMLDSYATSVFMQNSSDEEPPVKAIYLSVFKEKK